MPGGYKVTMKAVWAYSHTMNNCQLQHNKIVLTAHPHYSVIMFIRVSRIIRNIIIRITEVVRVRVEMCY